MYIESLKLKNVRTFVDETLDFIHPDRTFRPRKASTENGSPLLPKPRLPNVNLLLGDNGSGKSTVLRAIAMAALGPSFEDTKLPTSGLVRREPGDHPWAPRVGAHLGAELLLHDQDKAPGKRLRSAFNLTRRGELERATFEPWDGMERAAYLDANVDLWRPVFESNNPVCFAVGYGAARRVETPENLNAVARSRSPFLRAQRLQGLFQESYSLIPLRTWFPGLSGTKLDRDEVVQLLNRLLKPTNCTYAGTWMSEGDALFEHGGVDVEFRNLSDGYRAFIGWAADMLFHACYAGPPNKTLSDFCGIVLVDEIDLHLHPRWQMKVISTIARTFPRMQFILTSHSPLVAGTLEWMNIITLKLSNKSNSTKAHRLSESIHGLDADQVLISDFFGLKTTRAESKARQLDELTLQAALGDDRAAEQLISKLAEGMEEPG
jgi:hypothetical protein